MRDIYAICLIVQTASTFRILPWRRIYGTEQSLVSDNNMKRDKKYLRVWFDMRSIQRIFSEYQDIVEDPTETKFDILSIEKNNEKWNYDTLEEFLSELRSDCQFAMLLVRNPSLILEIASHSLNDSDRYSSSTIGIWSTSREKIIRLANIIESIANDRFIPLPPEPELIPEKPKIFIGHGGSTQWRNLKDHLQDQHGYQILSYETGSRAGHTIRDIIEELLNESSFAILVMTGEDVMNDGSIRTRQNVIHEVGLFQGRLGFTKAIVLKEDGTEEFSNIHGVHQIRYSKGNIKETFGDVLSVLSKEFGKRH